MSRFCVVSWNVENLFAPDQMEDAMTADAYDDKLRSLAQVVSQLTPDVLALQEVGGEKPLGDLQTRLNGTYPHVALGVPDRRGIRNAYLSKLPFTGDRRDITDFPPEGLESVTGVNDEGEAIRVSKLGRGGLQVTVEPVAGFKVHLINLHLKSKLLTYPTFGGAGPRFRPKGENERAKMGGVALLRRTAEATALRVAANRLLKDNPDDALIVLCDFNDVVEAATTQLFKGPPGSEIDSTDRAFNTPDKGDAARLFNLAPLIPEGRRYSRVHKRKEELIDHIYVSEELLPGRPRRKPQVNSHVDVLNGLPSIGDDPRERLGEPGSDHAPVSAEFELG